VSGTSLIGITAPACRFNAPAVLRLGMLLLLSLVLVSVPVQAAEPVANDDNYTVDEDSLGNLFDVLANDHDPDGDKLQIADVTQGLIGTVIVVHGGSRASYTPNPQQFGNDHFAYTVSDGNGGSDTARVNVTITEINDPPWIDPPVPDQRAAEDVAISIDLSEYENDLESSGTDLDWTVLGEDNCTVSGENSDDDELTFTPDPNFDGSDTVLLILSDPQGSTDTQSIVLIWDPVNDDPTARDDTGDTDEDSVLTVGVPGVLGNDDDVEGNRLKVTSYDATSALRAAVVVYANGRYTYDPTGSDALQALTAEDSVVDTFAYTVSDGKGGSDTATVRITVQGVNDNPTAEDDAGSTDQDSVLTASVPGVLGNDADLDGDTLQVTDYDTTSTQGAAVVVNANGSYTYDPTGSDALQALATGDSVVDTFAYTIGDGNGGSDTATVRITVRGVNDDPTARDDTGETDEDSVLIVGTPGVLDNDDDVDGDPLQVTAYDNASAQGAAVVVSANGGYSFNPTGADALQALAAGESVLDTFSYTVDDGNGGTATATVRITVQGVNDVPTAYDDQGSGYTTDEDTPFITASVLANDEDPDKSDSLAVVAVNSTGLLGQLTYRGDGTFAYDPDGQFEALGTAEQEVESFTYTIGDGNGGRDTATVSIVVNGVNDAPWATDNGFRVYEDTTENLIYPLQDDSDPESDSLTIIGTTTPMSGSVTITGDGIALVYTPAPDFYGYDRFTYTIDDGNGGSDTATIDIQVENTNDDPVAQEDLVDIAEDSGANALYVLANDTYLPDPVETLTIVSASPAISGTVDLAPDGSYVSYAPDPDYYGPDSFSYTIVDGNGGTAVGRVVVTVANVNDPPLARPDTTEIDEDSGSNPIEVLINDTYEPDPPETLIIVGFTRGKYGTVTIVGGGARLTYRPDTDYYGTDAFAYTIGDGNGGYHTASVNVTVRGVNDPPRTENDSAVTQEDMPVTVDVLANDEDIDGNLVPSTVRVASGPSHGSATVDSSDGRITYSPELNWNGHDAFTYRVCDDGTPLPSACNTATVDLSVGSVNDPPVSNAGPDQQVNTLSRVTLDGSGSTDRDGDYPLTYLWSQTGGPTVTLSSSTARKPTFVAPDDPCVLTFALRVIDSKGQADVTVDETVVTVLNQPPVANAGPDQGVQVESSVILDGSGSTDPDGDYPLTYLWSQTGGPAVTLSSQTAQRPTFVAPDKPSTLTFALFVVDALDGPDPTPDEVVIKVTKPFYVYMPVVANRYAVAPDLVVQSLTAGSNGVQLVIANQGNAPVVNEFWVDAYLDPRAAPTRVNQTWLDLADQGLVWGVTRSALSKLIPGGSLTLTAGTSGSDPYYVPDLSAISWPLRPGTILYAQVDSYDPSTIYGAVRETHELLGGAYNNIRGPIGSTAGATAEAVPFTTSSSPSVSSTNCQCFSMNSWSCHRPCR
jgi:VCBS repeat-containing protein